MLLLPFTEGEYVIQDVPIPDEACLGTIDHVGEERLHAKVDRYGQDFVRGAKQGDHYGISRRSLPSLGIKCIRPSAMRSGRLHVAMTSLKDTIRNS